VPRLSYDELDREYRAALRRIAQLQGQRDAFRNALLKLKGRLLGTAHGIDDVCELLEREHREHQVGHEVGAIASADVRLNTPL
jgi:hypothetical protein